MNAIVCDLCGHVVLQSDDCFEPRFFSRLFLSSDKETTTIDVCQNCTKRLIEQAKKIGEVGAE